ncbi:MAG TPA: peptide ABC transporter permease [Actinomycetota bacterium]|nr:peptide ABC transporter permease [Actinomycetota bacterium]
MRFALGEIRRAKLRFILLVGAVALLVFLILFQQTLAGSLLGQFTGGLEHQSASVLVYSADARRSVDGSRVLPQNVAAVAGVEGVAASGPIGEASFSAKVAGGTILDTTIFGYELGGPGAPTTLSEGRLPERDGEAVASAQDADKGYGFGQQVTIVPGATPISIVGLADDAAFNVQPTLFVSYATYEGLVMSTNPEAKGVVPNLVGVETSAGADPSTVAAAITAQVDGVEALDRNTAVASLPGVSSIQQSFGIILALAFVVVILLIGFFFLIVTVQKTASLTLLRAVGASGGFLLGGLIAQVLIVIGLALLVAIPLTLLAVNGIGSGGFVATVEPSTLVTTSISIILLGVVASIGAMRRVAKIDPAAATMRLAGGGLA